MTGHQQLRIAIDGPAAAGKSTVAKKIAKELSIVYIDTGAMYRALTLKALATGIDAEDENSLNELLHHTDISLTQNETGTRQLVYMDGKDVTDEIRSQEVSNHVSHVAKHTLVRDEMVKRQKKLANNVNVVMDGRDIGTNVLPNAEIKIFLIASVNERAKRRCNENKSRGISLSLEQLKQEIKERDYRDINRSSSPLVQADDAIAIDTTNMSIDQVVSEILQKVHAFLEKRNDK